MLFGSPDHPPIPTTDLVSWVFHKPAYDKDAPVYIDAADPSHSLSYNQSKQLIRKLCAGFKKLNLPKGSCILVNGFNSIEYPILFLGIIAAGHVFAGANPAYTIPELVHHIKITSAVFIISEADLLPKSEQAAKETGIPSSNILILHSLNPSKPEPQHPNYESWNTLLSHGETDWATFDDPQLAKSVTVCRLTSSGTTGLPKATKWTHYNLVAQHEFAFLLLQPPQKYETYQIRHLSALPMFHAAVVPRGFTSALKQGDQFYVMRRFDLEEFLRNIEKYAITELYAVPPMAVAISNSPLTNNKYSLRSLRYGLSGAAPLSKEVQAAIMKHMHPEATYVQCWGMTESTCIVSVVKWPEDDRTGSVGELVAGVEMKLVDEDGNDVTDYDVRGEACIRGPIVIEGYVGSSGAKANAESYDKDGFYHTGDIVVVQKSNDRIYVVDRKKELIKVRAFQVAPAELEGVLLTHPLIVDAAVIGIPAPDARDGELPRAYVVRRPGSEGNKLTKHDVNEWMKTRLARYKQLAGGVKFVDAIPKNPSGKILKRILREELKKEMQDKKSKL